MCSIVVKGCSNELLVTRVGAQAIDVHVYVMDQHWTLLDDRAIRCN